MSQEYINTIRMGNIPVMEFAVHFPHHADRVLGKVMRYTDGEYGYCSASTERLAWECGISRITAVRALDFLEANGLIICIEKTKGGKVPNKYMANFPNIMKFAELWKEYEKDTPPDITIVEEDGKSHTKKIPLSYLDVSERYGRGIRKIRHSRVEGYQKDTQSIKEYKKEVADAPVSSFDDWETDTSLPTDTQEQEPANERSDGADIIYEAMEARRNALPKWKKNKQTNNKFEGV